MCPAHSQNDGVLINRATIWPALMVLQTYLCEAKNLSADKTFVYISAEDIFRPVIPARYITTKREAEKEIADLCEASGHDVRPVFIRPSTCSPAVLPFGVVTMR